MKITRIKRLLARNRVIAPTPIITATALLALLCGPGHAMAQRPLGIDVSSYQGSGVNWSGEKSSGVSFAWAKATEGTYDDDADFTINENNGKNAGVYMGAYHFARPDLDSPGTEAGFFWNYAGPYIKNDGKTAMPALDFETFNGVVGAGSYSAWANTWCDDVVNDANGNGVLVRPVLYCSTCQACNFDGSVGQWIPWIANPSGESAQTGSPWGSTPCPTCGSGIWGSGAWDVWQYGGSSIDLDVFNGSMSDMVSTLVVGANSGGGATQYSAFVGPVVQNSDGRVEMFGIGANSDVWHDYQTAPNSGWNGWLDMANGNSIAGPAVGHDKDGRLELFASTGSGKVWHNFQTIGGGGAWNGWGSQGGPSVTNLIPLSNADGRLEVFGIGNDGAVWHEWQTTANGAWTTSWGSMGGNVRAGMVGAVNKDGRLEIFAQGTDGNVWHNWQTSPGQAFNGWSSMGSSSGGLNARLAIAQNFDGRLELFGVDSGGNVWHNYQNTAGGAWNGFIGFGGIGGVQPGFAVGMNADGRLEMFGVVGDTSLWHVWQDQPGTRWHAWSSLGGSWDRQLVVGNNKNGAVQVFGIGSGSHDVWSIYQTTVGGSWGSAFDLGGNGMKFFYGQP